MNLTQYKYHLYFIKLLIINILELVKVNFLNNFNLKFYLNN
jgi:hypothetical protein